MAHRLESTDTMFSVGTTPWHGLGTVLAQPPTIAEAIKIAGMDWRVEMAPNFTTIDGAPVATPSQSVIRVNLDADGKESRKVLASVGPTYSLLQNAEAFAWFQPWIDSGVATLETAGTLMGGTRPWVLAKLAGDPIVVKGDDIVERYILLAHAHDGTLAIRAGLTPVRVVCHNTLSAAIGIDPSTGKRSSTPDGMFKILHRANAKDRLADVAEEIAAIDERLAKAAEVYRKLASVDVVGGDARIVEFLGGVYKQKADEVRKGRRLPEIERLFASGKGQDLDGARGTYWGLYNALTEYHSHHAGRDGESRANANAFGQGAQFIRRGLDVALAMATKTYSIADVAGEFSEMAHTADVSHPEADLIERPVPAAPKVLSLADYGLTG